jgi:hypothetical protein
MRLCLILTSLARYYLPMDDDYEPYDTVEAPLLTTEAALRAVAAYVEDFISRGDIDVLFTVSGGAIAGDHHSADPAVWMDWVNAWRRTASSAAHTASNREDEIDIRHGYRALLTLLQAYTPIDATPMSVVLGDCLAVFNGDATGAQVLARWNTAVATGKHADISFRLRPSG